jgi:hypothetical protein
MPPRVGTIDGDRAAHCMFDDSPYWFTGYVLRYAGPWTPEVKAKHAEEEALSRRWFKRWDYLGGRNGRLKWATFFEDQMRRKVERDRLRRVS